MTLANVKLILGREIRDQLRDRRTLFMIAVLPILLYPLLGMSLFQLSQFLRERTSHVLVIGSENLADLPTLFENQRFADRWFGDSSRAKLLDLRFMPIRAAGRNGKPSDPRAAAQGLVQTGDYDAVLYFPPDFAERFEAFRASVRRSTKNHRDARPDEPPPNRLEVPNPEIIYSTANDKSQFAAARVADALRRWTAQVADDTLTASGVPTAAVRPFSVGSADVAGDTGHRGAAMWSKVLPVLLLLWALTGAFYPAIDLCAGEKERGTLETLLSSPAQRSEIVLGKLATIMLFSMATAVLNLVSLGLTGAIVLSRLPGLGSPPPTALLALAVALPPVAALFSALCLALAAFARSTKEGQYYLMPLLLVTMPLVVLPMSPGVELNLGNSLIPITGVVLLLRSALEGNYWQAIEYSPVVIAVTLGACYFAIRWAVDQFNSESVLFRESERLDLGLWMRHLMRDRQPTPNVAMALVCGVLILLVQFGMSLTLAAPTELGGFMRTLLITQLAVIATPALMMTVMLTTSPRQTLLLTRPNRGAIVGAALLAIALHPAVSLLQVAVQRLYPIDERIQPVLEKLQQLFQQADFLTVAVMIAVVPAVCEELAFRGFILSGFRHMGHKWRAIVLSAIFFGVTHGIMQQSLVASLMGVILGYLAVQTGSIAPCMVFHAVHNGLMIANSRLTPAVIAESSWLRAFVRPLETGGCEFTWPTFVVGTLAAVLLLAWFSRRPCAKSPEEALQETIRRGEAPSSLPACP